MKVVELKQVVDQNAAEMRAGFAKVDAEISDVRSEMREGFADMQRRMDERFEAMQRRMDENTRDLYRHIGAVMGNLVDAK